MSIEGKKIIITGGATPAGRRENILVAFPRSRVAGAELRYRALSGRGKLILGLGSGENYRQREVTLDPGDGGWKESPMPMNVSVTSPM